MNELHRRESDKYKTWHRVVIWATALGGVPAIVTAAVIIWQSTAGAVHASDNVRAVPGIIKRVDALESAQREMKEQLNFLVGWAKRHDD